MFTIIVPGTKHKNTEIIFLGNLTEKPKSVNIIFAAIIAWLKKTPVF